MDVIVPCDGLRCAQVLTNNHMSRSSLTSDQKRQLISSQKPTPDLSISQTQYNRIRTFKRTVYKTFWVAGCSHTNKLYCWCCIFFSNNNNAWNSTGYNDLKNLSNGIKNHSNTQCHMRAVIYFSHFGKERNRTSLSCELSDEISKYNSLVETNRSVFRRLVDIVIHLAQQELPLRGLDKYKTSLNLDNFKELVSLLSNYDFTLEKHNIQHQQCNEQGQSNTINRIYNNIISSITHVMKARINFEVNETKFVSILIDGTPDYGHQEKLYLILRYYFGNEIHNRFLCFIDVSDNLTADSISHIVLEALKEYNCTKKLVAQSYDGASLMYGVRKEVQQKVKDVCPEAIYTWCNAHNLTLKLAKSCNRIGEVSVFFSALHSLCNFFSYSTKRAALYKNYCKQTLPHAPATRWMYVSQAVNTLFEQRSKLISLFSSVCYNPQHWDGDTILAAESFDNILHSFNLNFFLLMFHIIFKRTDCLENILQKSHMDVELCSDKLKTFQTWLLNDFQSEFHQIYESTLQNNLAPRFRRKVSCAHTEYRRIFVQVIEIINSEINDHYSEIHKFKFFQLLDNKKFDNYIKLFPKDSYDVLFTFYGDHFELMSQTANEKKTLNSELACLYSSPVLKDYNIFESIDFINENTLGDAFPELLKLAYLIVTIPATGFTDRAFSSLNRIHNYLTNTQGQERLSELAMVAIDKQLIKELKRSPSFYSDVMKSFLEKDTQFDLEFK